jgi:hypothetical protein
MSPTKPLPDHQGENLSGENRAKNPIQNNFIGIIAVKLG